MDNDNVEMLNTGEWSPEQALLAALKRKGEMRSVVIVAEDDEGQLYSVAANADTKTMLLFSEMLRKRALEWG